MLAAALPHLLRRPDAQAGIGRMPPEGVLVDASATTRSALSRSNATLGRVRRVLLALPTVIRRTRRLELIG